MKNGGGCLKCSVSICGAQGDSLSDERFQVGRTFIPEAYKFGLREVRYLMMRVMRPRRPHAVDETNTPWIRPEKVIALRQRDCPIAAVARQILVPEGGERGACHVGGRAPIEPT